MKRSVDRILTTHTGSLPRPLELAEMLLKKDDGEETDPEALAAAVREAVAETVRKQVEAGVDVVSDGEQGKIGYSTYVKDRLTGFEGEATVNVRADWADFPDASVPLAARVKRPACNGPVAWKDPDAVQGDVATFNSALEANPAEEGFLTAASPGVIAHFLGNQYYATREEYLATLSDVMKQEFEAIVEAGFVLQLDCPDLAMSRHMRFPDLDIADFLKIAEGNVEALNHAISGIPADRVRLHLCWGNYEGPHHRDVPLRDILPVVLKANVGAISMEGANPRHAHEWAVFKDVPLPDDMAVIPGVIDSTTNFIEHPELVAQRIVAYAEVVGKERVIAGSDCGFGTFASTAPNVQPGIVWAKLASLAEGARLASEQLW
ncbi:MAG: cobalamin-independent methionine synthase II family protein [Chloroflexi bacterium]|nr:cobalamin-independent methionine synthase II family protein [Chloroflexota bacterium]